MTPEEIMKREDVPNDVKEEISKLLKEQEIQNCLLSLISSHLFITDEESQIISYYGPNENLYLEKEKFIGKPFSSILPPDVVQIITETIEKAECENLAKNEYSLVINDEKYFYEIVTKKNIHHGKKIFIHTINDVTEYKKIEELILFEKMISEAQIETSPDGILVVDENAKIISCNKNFIRLMQIPLHLIDIKNDTPILEYVTQQVQDPEKFIKKVKYLYLNRDEKSRDEIKLLDGKILDRYSAPLFSRSGVYHGRVWYFHDVTELNKAKHDYQLLFQEMLDGFAHHEIIFDENKNPIDYRFLEVNPAFEKLTGLNSDKIIGKTVSEVMPEIERKWIDVYGKVAITGEPVLFENYSHELEKHFEVTAFQTEPNHFACIFSDVTKRKKTEEAIKISENKFRSITENVTDLVFTTDAKGILTYVSPSCFSILGYTAHEMEGHFFGEYLIEEDFKKAISLFEQAMTLGIVTPNLTITAKHKNGKNITIELNSNVIKVGDSITGAIGSIRDISEIRKHEERYKTIVQTSIDGFWISDLEGNILEINDYFAEMLKYTPEELLKMKISDIEANENSEDIKEHIQKIMTNGCDRFETRHRCKDGSIKNIEISIAHLKELDKMFVFARDITERLQSAKEIKAAYEARTNFLAKMSHEIRTPMHGILGFTHLLELEIINPEQKEMLRSITESCDRLISTISDILDFSKLESGKIEIKKESVNVVNETKIKIEALKSIAINKNLELKFESESPEFNVDIDKIAFERIINNIVGNALKFTQKGKINIDIISKNNMCHIIITDTGCGIPSQNHKDIFLEFKQAKEGYNRPYEGSGLGLTIAKQLTNLMGGELYLVRSIVGIGSTFEIVFPLNNDNPDIVKIDEATVLNDKTIIILVVEDDAINKLYYKKVFEHTDYSVDFVSSGIEAIEKANNIKYNLILMDIGLKGKMNGIEAAKEIKFSKFNSSTKIIAVTGSSIKELGEGTAYFNNYLYKPFGEYQLLKMIKENLQ